jgi:hypothetical protein
MTGGYIPLEHPKWCCGVVVNNAKQEQAVRTAHAAPPAPEPDHPLSPVAIRMRRTRARRREGKRVIPLDVSIAQIEALVAAGFGSMVKGGSRRPRLPPRRIQFSGMSGRKMWGGERWIGSSARNACRIYFLTQILIRVKFPILRSCISHIQYVMIRYQSGDTDHDLYAPGGRQYRQHHFYSIRQ